MLRLREKARVAYEMANAKFKLSKLNNSVSRPTTQFKSGQLLILWRQRNRPGRVTGQWIGPVRMLLQEGGTLWLATGATLIRARTNQVRPCTRREELQASIEGTAILLTPVTMETLLKSFTGRNYINVTGEVPSERQRQDDVQGAEVGLEPSDSVRPDSWRLIYEGEKRWSIWQHTLPRLALFTPSRVQQCPVNEEKLTGKRITLVRPMLEGAEEVTIEDDFKASADPHRQLQERWKGETKLI